MLEVERCGYCRNDEHYNLIIDSIITGAYPTQFKEYCGGKKNVLNFLLGKIKEQDNRLVGGKVIEKIQYRKEGYVSGEWELYEPK